MLSSRGVHNGSLFNGRAALISAILLVVSLSSTAAEQNREALIRDALSAAPPEVAKTARVVEWDRTVLKEGSGAYTCYPTPAQTRKRGREPMCLDKTWTAWADAWANKKPFKADQVGIGYRLAGDAGSSNIDPYAEAPTSNNQWVVEGPHTMVIVPDPAQLEGPSTDPSKPGPYVMWKGTPYVHIMVPLGKRPANKR